jgi:RNA polymerase sigma factor (sigma-70 family)
MIEPHWMNDLALAQHGDRQAQERLLAGLRPHLEALARRHAEPGCATESTADLVQEATLRIWQKLDQFHGAADQPQTAAMFFDWVSQLVGHLAIDKARERHAQRRSPPGGLLRLGERGPAGSGSSVGGLDPVASGPTPSTNARADEQAQRIREALAKIPDDTDSEIVRLCFYETLPLRQVAERLNLSYDKVRERYHRCLRRLEHELEGLL